MSLSETAQCCFCDGASCSQAVFSTFADRYGIDPQFAFKIGSGFSGGMGRLGKTCGAITGGIMILGLEYGGTAADDVDGRNAAIDKTAEFIGLFERKHGTVKCSELIKFDMSNLEERKKASEAGVFKTVCPEFVKDAADILTDMLG